MSCPDPIEPRLRPRAGTGASPFAFLVLAARGLAPRSVAPVRQVAFAGRLALRRVGDGVVVVAAGRLIRPPPSRLQCLAGRVSRDEAVAALPDEVCPAHLG